jgi:polyisoprenoid-binding protein YceI
MARMNHDPVSVSTRARLTVTRVKGHSSASSNPSRRAWRVSGAIHRFEFGICDGDCPDARRCGRVRWTSQRQKFHAFPPSQANSFATGPTRYESAGGVTQDGHTRRFRTTVKLQKGQHTSTRTGAAVCSLAQNCVRTFRSSHWRGSCSLAIWRVSVSGYP